MVKVDVICMVTRAGCGRPVARGWLTGVWVVEPYVGGGCKVVVGEWCDVFGGSVEPCACADTAGGVMNPHGSGVEGVGAGCCVEVPDECCEAFLLVFFDVGFWCDFGDGRPECWVDIVGGSLELCPGVGQVAEEITHGCVAGLCENGGSNLLPAGYKCGVFYMECGCEAEAALVDGGEQLYVVVWGELPVQPLFV